MFILKNETKNRKGFGTVESQTSGLRAPRLVFSLSRSPNELIWPEATVFSEIGQDSPDMPENPFKKVYGSSRMKATVFVGIDVSKDSFDVSCVDEQEVIRWTFKFSMDRQGFDDFLKHLSQEQSPVIALESTGIYHVNLLTFLSKHAFDIKQVSPSLVKRFIESYSLRKTKTDAKDAHMIALYVRRNHNTLISYKPEARQGLTQLTRTREDIQRDIRKTKNHIKRLLILTFPELEKTVDVFLHSVRLLLKQYPSARIVRQCDARGVKKAFEAILSQQGRKMKLTPGSFIHMAKESIASGDEKDEKALLYHLEHLAFLEKRIMDMEKRLIDEAHKRYQKPMAILTSFKGMGNILASQFLSEVGDIHRFQNYKKLIAYAGTDPVIKESGLAKSKGGISKRGSAHLRHVGFLIARCAILHDTRFKLYYKRKKEEGMSYKMAVIATWNKMAKIIHHLLTHEIYYVPDFV